MKIAVFDHVGNWGGGSRYVRALLLALKSQYPSTAIAFFGNQSSIIRENLVDEFSEAGIEVYYLTSTTSKKCSFLYKAIRMVAKKIHIKHCLYHFLSPEFEIKNEIEILARGYNIAFFPWPYFIDCPSLKIPMVGVFHDFNYKYFFGAPIFTEDQFRQINLQISNWLLKATPIVSSRFIAAELEKFYPTAANKVEIVNLAPFNISNLSEPDAQKIIKELGVNTPFILYPTNLCHHKNIGILLRAMYLLRVRGVSISLVITGPNTECTSGRISEHGVEKDTSDTNVFGLGYVTNLQMDALIHCATAVISTSLYEAGNGPGLEAWGRGVPVIMSDIPSFVEHIEVLGVQAALVDPYDANDVAEKIYNLICKYDQAISSAELSRNNLSKYTWKKVAIQYHEIFCKLVSAHDEVIL